jgi:tetratricopeptide (TPR) repeat protein
MTADDRAAGPKVAQDSAMPEVKIPESVHRHRISGVFSSQTVVRVGTGTTSRKVIQKAYWYAEEAEPDEDGSVVVRVRPLNKNNVPSGQAEAVPKADFLERYSPELEYYQKEVFPRMKELDSTLKRAETQREQGALYSAQFEYEAALNVDEENVRANFGLGLTYMERGEAHKAGDIFKRVVALDAAFAPEHKHLFNEFGINLRKSKLHDQAVEYYERALQLTDNDENLHYNIARAYFERGDRDQCVASLRRALELNPHFEEAQKFLAYVEKEGGGLVLDA